MPPLRTLFNSERDIPREDVTELSTVKSATSC